MENPSALELPTPDDVRRDLTRKAVIAARRTVPVQLVTVVILVAMALNAGLVLPAAFAGVLGVAVGVWRWRIGQRFGERMPDDEVVVAQARRQLELNAALAGVLWVVGSLAIYPRLGANAPAYVIIVAGSVSVAASWASGRAYLCLLVPQITSLVLASFIFEEVHSLTNAILFALYGVTMYRASLALSESTERFAGTLLERDALREDHARLLKRDMEEARRAATEAQAAAIAARDLFVAKVSHEFITPLQAVVSVAEVIEDKAGRARLPMLEAPLRRLRVEIDQVIRQARDLSNYARAQASGKFDVRPERIELRDLIEGATAELKVAAEAKGLELLVDAPPASLVVDGMRLRQIVINLTSNAVKYTRTGRVAVVAEYGKRDGFSALRLSVTDTGPGIPETMVAEVFKPWVRAGDLESPGLGLGLSIVKSLVDALNGAISVHSTVGEGTTVEVKLPVAPVPGTGSALSGQPPALAGLRILVVDDSAAARNAVTDGLVTRGACCDEVASGHAALELLGTTAYDVLLVDLQMPQMDGYDLANCVRRLAADRALPRPRIVAMSAYQLDPLRAAMFDDFVAKPASYADLARALAAPARVQGEPSARL